MKKFFTLIAIISIVTLSCIGNKDFEGLKELNGTELYVKKMGSGDPVIVIHGGPGLNFGYFLPQLEPLAENHTLIFYDQRVSGRSSGTVAPQDINLRMFMADIDALREEYGYEKVNLLAHSWGNLIALEYALNNPEHVDKIILSNPTALGPDPEYNAELAEIQRQKFTPEFMAKRDSLTGSEGFINLDVSSFEELFKLNFSISFADPEKLDELNFNLSSDFFDKSQQMRMFNGLNRPTYFTYLSQIEAPTLLIRGAYDISVKAADQRAVDSLANGQLVEFENSGHFPFVEEPDEFISVVEEFLGNN